MFHDWQKAVDMARRLIERLPVNFSFEIVDDEEASK